MEGRTKLLLGILAALLAITLWRYLGPGDDPAPPAPAGALGAAADPESLADPVPGRRRARRSAGEEKTNRVEVLRVADLQRPPRDYTPGRDPWRFVEPPPPPPPPPPPQPRGPSPEELERMRQAQEELARQRAAELARQQAEEARRPPPFTMTYLGSFGPPERRIAVFSDGKSIINAQEGEVIGGKFIVAHIGYESVDIQAVGYPDAPPQRLAVGRPSPSR